jgi:hypothetical protein
VTALSPGVGISRLAAQGIIGAAFLLILALFVLGLVYRFWRWITTPDEQVARKQASRRERLKRTVRRPARDVPIDDGLQAAVDVSDPVLNTRVLE